MLDHLLRATAIAGLMIIGMARTHAATPQADFLFVGSYHMNNPGRDVHNVKADDVLSERRQREIAEVATLIAHYRPTKVMVERDIATRDETSRQYTESCAGRRPLARGEAEQLGFRIACALHLATVYAVDQDALTPVVDEEAINWPKAIERHHQQDRYEAYMAAGKALNDEGQRRMQRDTIVEILRWYNADTWLHRNAASYYQVGLFGTHDDPAGASWMQYWYGRNLAIFNNIARLSEPGDRILVIYGAGHGNMLRQLASDSGAYRVHDPLQWLSAATAAP